MISRLLLVIIIIGFSACSNPSKESETSQAENATTPEGVIISAQTEVDTLKGSLKAYTTGKIGETSFTINYYSPATRGRIIWGGLVAFENVWVTGAHKATNLEFNKPIKIGESVVTPGKYAIFTIPGMEEWTIILNKNWEQHLTDEYDQKDDVVRVKIKPELENPHQERLRYVIESINDTEGAIVIHWDKLEISLPITISAR